MPIIYLLPVILILTYLSWLKTEYGLYIILATVPGYLLRTKLFSIPTNWLDLAIVFVFSVWLIKLLKNNNLEARFYLVLHQLKPYVIPIVLLLISVLISIIISQNQLRALGILKSWFLAPLLFTFMFLDQVKTKKQANQALFFLSLSVWPIIIYGLIDYFRWQNLTIPGRLDSFFSSPNYVAMYLVPIFLLILSTKIIDKKIQSYDIIWLMICLTTILLTKSFGGWFATIAGLIFIILFYKKITLKKTLALVFLFIIITISLFFAHQKSFYHYDKFWQINSLETRKQIWFNSIKILTKNPILGIGLGDFKLDYQNQIKNLEPSEKPIEKEVLRPHNLFLDFWLETTILGLIAFSWIILAFYQQNLGKNKKNLSLPTTTAITAILIHGLVDTPYFKNDLSLLFWLIITLSIVTIRKNKITPTI